MNKQEIIKEVQDYLSKGGLWDAGAESPYLDDFPKWDDYDLEEITNVHLYDKRWGTQDLLVYRVAGDWYLGIDYYSFSGDSSGPIDAKVYEVIPKEVQVTKWEKV